MPGQAYRIDRDRGHLAKSGIGVAHPADRGGILGRSAGRGAYPAHAEQHPATAHVITAGADDDGADIVPRTQHAGAENGGLAGIARLVLDQDPIVRRAELQEKPPHHHSFGRRMTDDPAGDEKVHGSRRLGELEGRSDAAPERAAGRPVGTDSGSENDDAVSTGAFATQGPRSIPAIVAAPP
jgi:hypothetical protein